MHNLPSIIYFDINPKAHEVLKKRLSGIATVLCVTDIHQITDAIAAPNLKFVLLRYVPGNKHCREAAIFCQLCAPELPRLAFLEQKQIVKFLGSLTGALFAGQIVTELPDEILRTFIARLCKPSLQYFE